MIQTEIKGMDAPVPALFAKFALPSIITMLFFGMQNLIDGIVVGNALGAAALGGINIILPLFSMIMVVALIVGVGSQTLVSQGMGNQNPQQARQAAGTGFFGLTASALSATVLLWLLREPLVRALGADEVLLPHATAYLNGLVPFILPMAWAFYNDLMIKALGRPLLSTLIMSGVVVMNIALSLLFVLVLDLGVFGASLATGLAFTFACAVSAVCLPKGFSMIKGGFSLPLLGKAVYNGSSEGVAELSSAIAVLIINRTVMSQLGAEGVSAYTAINYIQFVGVLVFLGISDGLIPVMAYHFGARKLTRLWRIVRFTAKANALIGAAVFALLQLSGDGVVRLFFQSGDREVVEMAAEGLRIFSWVFLFEGLTILITGFFTAIGNAAGSIVIASLRGVVFIAVGMAVLPELFGADGIWFTLVGSELLSLLAAVFLLKRKQAVLGK